EERGEELSELIVAGRLAGRAGLAGSTEVGVDQAAAVDAESPRKTGLLYDEANAIVLDDVVADVAQRAIAADELRAVRDQRRMGSAERRRAATRRPDERHEDERQERE